MAALLTTRLSRPVLTRQARTLLLTALMLVPAVYSMPASAVVVQGLFDVEIPVPDETRSKRQAAMADGLAEILVRVSGDRNILQKIEVPSTNTYVKQFRYIAIDTKASGVDPGDDPSATRHKLSVQYNPTRIMDLLRKNAIPIWGEHRSQAVIWLAVRDGTNQYVLRDEDVSLLKQQANDSFQRRGIPVIWPQNDLQDRQQLRFADIWAGFARPIQEASKRYTSGPVVSASMAWNGHTWSGDWSVFMGSDSRRWALEQRDYDGMISQAIDLIADAMGQKYAVMEKTSPEGLKQILVEIEQVESVKKFRHVQKYLNSLPVVQSVKLSQVEPERVAFNLVLRSEVDDFLKLVRAGNRMAPLVMADAQTAAVPVNKIYRFKFLN